MEKLLESFLILAGIPISFVKIFISLNFLFPKYQNNIGIIAALMSQGK